MNEISALCDGECNIPFEKLQINTKSSYHIHKFGFDPDHPPYIPGGVDLNSGTMSLSGVQYLSRTYNLHNLYGFLETKGKKNKRNRKRKFTVFLNLATNKALEKVRGERSLVISRSTFSGSGKYGKKIAD